MALNISTALMRKIAMHLEEHLKESGKSQADFGQLLQPPASQALVSQWVRGVTRVTLDYALQIERASNGAVTPQDCFDMYRSARVA